jgi:hypothetical protein
MATTMVALFSSIGEHMPMFREAKQLEATPESWVNRLHFRLTSLLLLVAVAVVTCTEWISGTGSMIECMHGPGLPEGLVKWYCYIQVGLPSVFTFSWIMSNLQKFHLNKIEASA